MSIVLDVFVIGYLVTWAVEALDKYGVKMGLTLIANTYIVYGIIQQGILTGYQLITRAIL